MHRSLTAVLLAVTASSLLAQEPAAPVPQGKVVFSRSTDAEEPPPAKPSAPGDTVPATPVTDAERTAIAITAYDLDLHLTPATAHMETRTALTLRSTSGRPITRIPLQISSTLHWESITLRTGKATFTQSPIATDTDHTGYAQEAVLTLASPLLPGEALDLNAFYTGEIHQASSRLELIGTPAAVAAETDWDQISAAETAVPTALRGFGNVLWYPCAAPVALLGDGNRLFTLVGQTRLAQAESTIRLRLTVEYTGEAPGVAIFNGQVQPFDHTADTQNELVAETHGIATASFPAHPLGFRIPSLFLAERVPGTNPILEVVTIREGVATPYLTAADQAQSLLTAWLGEAPTRPLLILDHPGQTFEDEALLVTPLQGQLAADLLAPIVVHGLTHAWIRSSQPWIEEGFAQFMGLLWMEQTQGRPAVVAELQRQANLIALAEPEVAENSGQPLIHASADIYLRAKAAAVWWQLRTILGDEVLKKGMQAYRRSLAADRDPKALQRALEKASARDLAWFFDDWVNRDRSLPDLTIVAITPHPLPVRPGKDPGYLVAVEVRNDGDAIAEVPVTIRSGELSATERLRIPPHASSATRIPFQSTPKEVQVNDGTVPELRATIHTRQVVEIP